MWFSAAELAEIRRAFRRRIATAPAPKRVTRAKCQPSPKQKRGPKAAPVLVRDPEFDDGEILTPRVVAELFAVSPRTIRRWADAGVLPSFRTVGAWRRFRWCEIVRRLKITNPSWDTPYSLWVLYTRSNAHWVEPGDQPPRTRL
jgi:excisionase family DNA binding protein